MPKRDLSIGQLDIDADQQARPPGSQQPSSRAKVPPMANSTWIELLPEELKRATAPIYHYTGAAALLSIIKLREFWATEASGLNDVAEIRQGWAFIRSWLKEQPDGHVQRLMREMASSSEGDDGVRGAPHVTDNYILSASTIVDDANQWRLYGSGGRGYSLELDPTAPLVVLSTPPKYWEDHLPLPAMDDTGVGGIVTPWIHVLYTDESKERALDGLVRKFELAVESGGTLGAPGNLWPALGTIAALMKTPGFSGEREVRVIVSEPWADCVKFHATAYGVVRHVKLTASRPPLNNFGIAFASDLDGLGLPLNGVWLGPLLGGLNNRESILGLLSHYGFHSISCRQSHIPLGRG